MKIEVHSNPGLVKLDSIRPGSTFISGVLVYIKTDRVGLGSTQILVVELGSGWGIHLSGHELVNPVPFKVVRDTEAGG